MPTAPTIKITRPSATRPGPSVDPGLGPIRFQGGIETGYTESKNFPAEAAGGAN
jgi:2-keto-3-deoxy-6-phosphogluconate aldolase